MPKVRTKPAAPITIGEGDFVTCKQAGGLVLLSELSIRRLLTKGKLKRYKIGSRTLVKKSELMGLIREVK